MADESILNMIVDAANTALEREMKTLIEQSDLTRAGLVRIGLLQDDPLKAGVNILTHIGDPEDEKGWRHTVVRADTLPMSNAPAYQVGGGEMWYRRFTTELTQFFRPSAKREDARRLASVILSRAEYTFRNLDLSVGPDSFGEIALQANLHSSINTEGGGDGQFIWRGRIYWVALTEVGW